MTNIDIYVLLKELGGHHFSKIVRVPGGYKIKLSGGKDLLVVPGKYIIPTSYVIEADRPDNLSVISRRRLGNARIEAFEQLNFDRILRIQTDRGAIIIESFGGGNIVITDEDGRIFFALRERDWGERSIRRGEEYSPPHPPKLHPNTPPGSFAEALNAKDVVRSLVRAGLPPIYAEELCTTAGVDKNTPITQLNEDVVSSLYSAFSELIETLQNPEPVVVYDGDEIIDILPIPLSRYESYSMKRFPSFSDALDLLTPSLFTPQAPQQRKKKDIVEFWRRQLENAKQELSLLNNLIEGAYGCSYELENAIKSKKPPEELGPFKLKKYDGREIVYDFIPPT